MSVPESIPWEVRQWSLIETDEFTHIVPTETVRPFGTRQQAEDFLEKMQALGNPVVTDGEHNVIGTYIGHTLDLGCFCQPTEREPGLLAHHLPN